MAWEIHKAGCDRDQVAQGLWRSINNKVVKLSKYQIKKLNMTVKNTIKVEKTIWANRSETHGIRREKNKI